MIRTLVTTGSSLVDEGANPFQPTITLRPLSIGEAMIITSGGGTPTSRPLRPEDPTPLPQYMELFI